MVLIWWFHKHLKDLKCFYLFECCSFSKKQDGYRNLISYKQKEARRVPFPNEKIPFRELFQKFQFHLITYVKKWRVEFFFICLFFLSSLFLHSERRQEECIFDSQIVSSIIKRFKIHLKYKIIFLLCCQTIWKE